MGDDAATSGEGLLRFLAVGTGMWLVPGAGAGAGAGEAAETGESASGELAASARTCRAASGAIAVVAVVAEAVLLLPRDSDLALKSDLYGPFAGRPWLSPPPRPALSSGVLT